MHVRVRRETKGSRSCVARDGKLFGRSSRPNSRSMRSGTLSRSNLAPSLTLALPLSPSRSLSRARALPFSLAFFLSCSLSLTRVRSLSLSLSRCRVAAVFLSRAARPRCRRLSLCHGRVCIFVYVWCVVVYCVVCCVVCIRAGEAAEVPQWWPGGGRDFHVHLVWSA